MMTQSKHKSNNSYERPPQQSLVCVWWIDPVSGKLRAKWELVETDRPHADNDLGRSNKEIAA